MMMMSEALFINLFIGLNVVLALVNLWQEYRLERQLWIWRHNHNNIRLHCLADCAYRNLDGDYTCRLKGTALDEEYQCLNFEPMGGNNHDEKFSREGQK